MKKMQSLVQQVTDLPQLEQEQEQEQEQKQGNTKLEQPREQGNSALHNDIIATLSDGHVNLSGSGMSCCQLQTRFLQQLSLLCRSSTISIYQLMPDNGYFHLESYYSRQGFRPQSSFIAANAPVYISNNQSSYCNFAIAPMRFASNMEDLHWYFDKTSRYALLISYNSETQDLTTFDYLTDCLLRTTLALYLNTGFTPDHQAQPAEDMITDQMNPAF